MNVVIYLSQGDSRIGGTVSPFVANASNVEHAKAWDKTLDLSNEKYNGGCKDALILVAHAKENNFVTKLVDGVVTTEVSGTDVMSALKLKGLIPERYAFVLIAGCRAAGSDSPDALFAQVGRVCNIPCIASTDPVEMTAVDDKVTLTPRETRHSSGQLRWMVFYANEGSGGVGAVRQLDSHNCINTTDDNKSFSTKLDETFFLLKGTGTGR